MAPGKSKKDSGSVAASASASVSGDSRVSTATRAKKKFRRIRGLLTGESRRERKAKKEAARQAAIAAGTKPVATTEPDDEDETIYGVDVENASLVSKRAFLSAPGPGTAALDSMAESRGVSHALQVILLLMDPKTRRFELLQLEFDSNKAVVRDVLSQVPHSVTEEALRQQNFTGVCDRLGQELYNSTRLADVCTGSDILIALPANVEARECARLARPILQDRNVIEMLRSSGVDTKGLEEPPVVKTPAKTVTAKPAAPPSPIDSPIVSPMASPVKPLAKAPEAFPLDTESRNLFPPEAPASPAMEAPKPRAVEEVKTDSKRTFFIVVAVIVAILVQVVHMSVTAPLGPGHNLSPNGFISKCGYKALVPAFCEEATLSMDEDGVLTLYDSKGEVEWQMSGGVCEKTDTLCKSGLVVNADGSLDIGGKRINVAAIYGEAMFSPWPFTASPSVRLVRGRK